MKKVVRRNRFALDSFAEQRRLLQMEYEEEKRIFSETADRIGIEKLAEKGNAWINIKYGKTWHNSLNRRVIEVFNSEQIENNTSQIQESEKDHNFEYGRPVMLFEFSNDNTDTKIRGISNGKVSYVEGERMIIEVAENFIIPTSESKRYGVMLSFDETTYKAMFDAIDKTSSAKGRLGELRDLIYSNRNFEENRIFPIRLPYLNSAQEKGVNKVLSAKDVAIVHGPPGTGKTTTLVEAIYETLRRENQVLVCAQSNSAVDLICERLVDRGIKVLRIGNPTRVNDKMLSSTYERRFEDHPNYPLLWKIRKTMREFKGIKKKTDSWHRKYDTLKREATELEISINNDLFGEARVIASTLVGSDHRILDNAQITTLFIDEAAQALEPASWIPMRRAQRVVLAGDHYQLPATVKCYEAQKQGLGISLMEKIVKMHPEAVTLLSIQYRMHEDIMKFSSDWFYNGVMTAAKEIRYRGILDLDVPIEWIDSNGLVNDDENDTSDEKQFTFKEAIAGKSNGRINVDEALLTLISLQDYLEKIGSDRIIEEQIDIAVISPYRAQVQYLRKLISNTPFFKPFRKLITVNTIDGFQGRESDVVIISLVRSNDAGNIGFLKDLRRMNVAMTRARMKLIIIGNSTTLTRHPFYKKLFSYTKSLKTASNKNFFN